MRLAIVHDYLCGVGGSERVFEYICQEFSEADIYTLAYNSNKTFPYFKSRRIAVTKLNSIVRSMNSFRWSFPFATYAMESLDLSEYEIVLSSSATVAKYVNVPNGKHICYCYIPTRALWQTDDYFGGGLKSMIIKPALAYLRYRDYAAAQRVDEFISISQFTKDCIQKVYNRDSTIIPCPINLNKFYASKNRSSSFIIVSRLEKWKRVDFAISAFTKMGLPLRVIGTGEEEMRLRSMAGPNITFLGSISDEDLAREYAEARAVVFTPFLEYGLVPLEANASGTPVICLGIGGTKETMIPWQVSPDMYSKPPTAIFFYEQTENSLIDAVRLFELATFSSEELIKHASNWGVLAFQSRLRQLVGQFRYS